MLVYLVLGIVLVILSIIALRWFEATSSARLAKNLKRAFLGIGILMALYFAVTGKIGLAILPLALTFLPVLFSSFRNSAIPSGDGSSSSGQSSQVETEYLKMELDHDSGRIDGVILKGLHANKNLQDLSFSELRDLHEKYKLDDIQSARLVESFMDREFGAEWQAEEPSFNEQSTKMTEAEAYAVLGLEPGSSKMDIREAHHKLLLKIHPDHGGSDYLATKINQAKELLLNGK